MSVQNNIHEMIEKLPPNLQKEVEDFTRFLVDTKINKKRGQLRMSWAGSLKEFRSQFNSLELQKKSLEWWGD